jgi:hypothetical protein
MSEGTYWDYAEAAWVPSPRQPDLEPELPEQRTALAQAEEADVRSG